ncbi:hypothetical protein VPH35_107169 [Triticum aestivum]
MDVNNGDGNGICFPYDVLLHILRQLPCRPLAESRRVCRAWRAIVDGHKLLFRYMFPASFPGIFTKNYNCDDKSSFLAPSLPARSARLHGPHDGPVFRHPVFRHGWASVIHHCNGLLLLLENDYPSYYGSYYVCNPATVRCAPLSKKGLRLSKDNCMFLAFDPAVSLHYQVFKLPSENTQEYTKIATLGAEEPEDKVISVLVFSSQTGQWAGREFVPGPCAAGHLCDMVTAPRYTSVGMWKSAEYWRGSLYVHCRNNIIMILHISDGTYDMAQLPGKAYDENQYLGYSKLLDRAVVANYESGVHYVALDKFILQVWTLMELVDGQVRWMLAHEADLSLYEVKIQEQWEPRVLWDVVEKNALVSLFEPCNTKEIIYDEDADQSDTTDDVDGDDDDDEEECIHEEDDFDGTTNDVDDDGHNHSWDAHEDEDGEIKSEEGSEYESEDFPTNIDKEDKSNSEDDSKYYWDSDEDNFIDLDESAVHFKDEESEHNYRVLGLHPHKDVVLLRNAILGHIVAYHFRTSRIQHLGERLVRGMGPSGAHAAFPYRPCYVDALPATKLPYNIRYYYNRY